MIALVAALPMGMTLLDHSIREWNSTPKMQIADAYKWLFHATMGGEHAITNESGPKAWMDREWQSLGPSGKDEPMVVQLDPDGRMLRVNLRPFRAHGGDKDALLRAFIDSAKGFRADRTRFIAEWKGLGERLAAGKIMTMTMADWTGLDAKMRVEGYPAIHHSDAYEDAYLPAYRVVAATFWKADGSETR